MIKMTVENTGDKSARLNISGSITVGNISSLYKKITELLGELDKLEINIGKDSEIDLTFMQVICSAHRTFQSEGKNIFISGDKENLYAHTDAMGYTRHKGCIHDTDNSCVFTKEV